MMKVSMVPREHVIDIWDTVKPHLEKAAEYTYGRYEVEDILDCLTDYDYTLWIAFDDKEIKGAVVTMVSSYPRKKYLDMVFTGGVELEKWKKPMLELLQKWAFDTECDGIESIGRPGWAKIFKSDGHKPLWNTYELPVAKTGLGDING
tara:strand:- start:2198 stop:2641 length:444 start_codon:yes stop_codon:yes gene_type:complete